MPVVSRFFGIAIAFYWEDHLPPHFHAKYSGDEAQIEIQTGIILRGQLSRRVLSLVDEWRRLHQNELLDNWERARQRQPLAYIPPLEYDVILHVLEAKYEHDYIIHLKFNDGAEGFVDLADELYGKMFAPLKDTAKFKAFRVDPELDTVVWENGADLAPEFLYDRLLVASPSQSETR